MGQIVEFPSNGKTAQGYLALPDGTGPGVVVIQEWWGLDDHIKDIADRFAKEGFVALAPDLYHGKATKEPDEAGKLMMEMDIDRTGLDMAGAVAYLKSHERVQPKKVGSVGFCMGGNLALLLGTITSLDAAVGFYPAPRTQPEWSKQTAAVLLHVAGKDHYLTPEGAEEIAAQIRKGGKDVEIHVYPDAEHAFFNDTRSEVYRPGDAKEAWERTVAFFRKHLS